MDTKYMPLVPFVLVLCHFAFDWLYQSHAEAIAKSQNKGVRFLHCGKYATPFIPILWLFGMNPGQIGLSFLILFGTHYVIDSYVPVMLWAKYLRKAPQFDLVVKVPFKMNGWHDKEIETTYKSDIEAFKAVAGTPLGLILIITMDQFLHILCLLPVAYMAMR
jgi:hypothetical protein